MALEDRERTAPEKMGVFGESVGFLVSQIGAAVARRFGSALSSLSLEPRHFALLNAIENVVETTQQALSERLQIPASSLVALLDQLEGRGVLERSTHPSDRRVRIVRLTNAGRTLLQSARAVAIDTEQSLCGHLSREERSALIELLHRVADELQLSRGVHPGLSGEPCPPEGPHLRHERRARER